MTIWILNLPLYSLKELYKFDYLVLTREVLLEPKQNRN